MVWTQIRPNRTSGLVRIQTVWHSVGFFWNNFLKKLILKKADLEKKSADDYGMSGVAILYVEIYVLYIEICMD